jgi:N utilization substance protein B
VQALFQSEQTGESAEVVIAQFVQHRLGGPGYEEGGVPEADVPLFAGIVRSAAQRGDALDQAVMAHLAANWPLQRLDPVLRAVLRASAAELTDPEGPPARVVINEYLDVIRGFLDEQAARFANGVMDALAHRVRPAEFGG